LTDLAYVVIENGGELAERLSALGTSKDKARLVAESILNGTLTGIVEYCLLLLAFHERMRAPGMALAEE
jgi:hypothetical protein